MNAPQPSDDLDDIVDAGERIYAERLRPGLEKDFPGQYVVINIDTGQAVVKPYPEDAVAAAHSEFGTARQHLIHIGSSSAVNLGFFDPHGSLARSV